MSDRNNLFSLFLREAGWEDLRFPAQAINPAGAVNAPTVDTDLAGFPGTLLFSGAQVNVIAGIAQMSHMWDEATPIKPHIHWCKTTSSALAVDWQFYYRHLGNAGDLPGAWVGPIAGVVAAGDPSVGENQCITTFGDIDMTGRIESACINWQLRRAGSTDAYNSNARLYELDFHYQVVKPGTFNEYSD